LVLADERKWWLMSLPNWGAKAPWLKMHMVTDRATSTCMHACGHMCFSVVCTHVVCVIKQGACLWFTEAR
jgi:hypothetical protein